jgi:hypothetical protein
MLLLVAAALVAASADAPKPLAAAPNCPRTTRYLADKSGLYRGQPLTPRKLTELPSATAYMAVYRRIGGCEAPLTVVDYRNPRRR